VSNLTGSYLTYAINPDLLPLIANNLAEGDQNNFYRAMLDEAEADMVDVLARHNMTIVTLIQKLAIT
jgi:hypothetical protein